jgi:hypothetical protein
MQPTIWVNNLASEGYLTALSAARNRRLLRLVARMQLLENLMVILVSLAMS